MIPATFRQVAIDPSSVGLAGAVGEVVSGPGGLTAWVKYGPNATDWQAFPGTAGLLSVTATAPLAGAGTSGSPLVLAAASGSVPGSMAASDFSKLSSVIDGGAICSAYSTPEIDLSVISAGNVIVPARAGYYFYNVRFGFILTTVAGSMSTAPVVTIQTGAGKWLNASSIFPSAAIFALGLGGSTNGTPASIAIPSNTALTVEVPTAATGTGGFVAKAKYWAIGMWIGI